MWCVRRVFSSLAGLYSVIRNALQNATQLFFDRILQMTKYYVMRECENIHSWISLSGDIVLSHQQGIYGFQSPKRFLEISSRDLTLLSILIIQRPNYPIIGAYSLSICKAECLASSSQTFPQYFSKSNRQRYTLSEASPRASLVRFFVVSVDFYVLLPQHPFELL